MLHCLTTSIHTNIEHHLCPFHAGSISFLACLQIYTTTIDFWQRVIKCRKGVSTGYTHLHCLVSSLDLQAYFSHLSPGHHCMEAKPRASPGKPSTSAPFLTPCCWRETLATPPWLRFLHLSDMKKLPGNAATCAGLFVVGTINHPFFLLKTLAPTAPPSPPTPRTR